MKTGAVIVAAGMSSRMKTFKPLLALCGSTIIGTVIASLRASGTDEIVVVTGNQAEKLEAYLSADDVTCLYNSDYQTTEMFDSAKIGLGYLKDRCDRMFFLPGDVPLFSEKSLTFMLRSMDCSGCKILMPIHEGKMGHPILIDSGAVSSLLAYSGAGGLKGAIDSFSGLKRTAELNDAGITMDADNPEDYERLKNYARRRPNDTDAADV